MTLTKYIEKYKIDRREFAALIGVDPISLYRWETGKRFPREHIRDIMKHTNGKVTANDFFDEAAA